MVSEIFIDVSVIIILVIVASGIMRLLRQPLIIGYIITGILVSPYILNILSDPTGISLFAEIGIAILLFVVGLHLDPKIVKEVGLISLITGIGQVVFTALIGFFILKWLGLSTIVSIYVAIALTFSSTIVITKLLSDKGDIDSLYGRIAIGFLIVQDIIAVLISIVISSFSQGSTTTEIIGKTLFQGFGLIIFVSLFGIYILPSITKKIAKSQEFLLVFSLGWCLILATLFEYLNFSLEIGALLAGITLAASPYRYEISSKLKPLRDFFVIMFFILLGSQITFSNFSQYVTPIILMSVFILIGNPLIVIILMNILGYTMRTSFFAGLTVAQISEISLILIALGVKVGHLTPDVLSFVTIIGIITFVFSTYLIIHANKIYRFISPILKIFERRGIKIEESLSLRNRQYEIILLGYNRIGFSFLETFSKLKKNYLIVDFNPETIKKLKEKGINCIYGDANDIELLEELKIEKAEIVISTIPDTETNMLILEKVRSSSKRTIIMLTSHQISDALRIYKGGADYVILPHFLGGKYAASLLEHHGTNKELYKKLRSEQISSLQERIEEGHEHPKIERN